MQFNCNGIKNKQTELAKWLDDENILIAALQETKLTSSSPDISIPNFSMVRKDRGRNKGGGLAFLIHDTVQYTVMADSTVDPHLEHLAIKVNNLVIVNVYIPPASSCAAGYTPSLLNILPQSDALILGDMNAHDPLWFSSIQDPRGERFAEEIGNSNFGVLNEDTPTRLPPNGQPTSPDISLASMSIIPYTRWETMTAMNSDHLPIIINIKSDIKPELSENRKFINFRKADWQSFKESTEKEFAKLRPPANVYKAEKAFRAIINKAARKCIPAGRIKKVVPEIPTATAKKIEERNKLRAENPQDDRIQILNQEIDTEIRTYKKDKWRETVENTNDSSKLFKLIKSLNGAGRNECNHGIKFKGKFVSRPKDMANMFNKQFTSIVKHKSSRESRKITRNLKSHKFISPLSFTSEQTRAAIKQAKASKAIGPDKISNLHLKHLGAEAIGYLTDIFNLSIKTSQIPQIWKCSVIIPLLKPGKDRNDSNSYRPVSLLCPAIKIMERVILPILDECLPVPDVQHGFRKMHSTVTALHDFNQDICRGFNKKKPSQRTILLQLDLSKAFDMVSHDKLLADIHLSNLPPELKRWFNCYLHGRQSRVNFRNTLSKSRNIRAGVPQGAVTSPKLFNFYLANIPDPPPGVKLVQYADDLSVYKSLISIPEASEDINGYVPALVAFLNERELMVSAEKSTVTLFTPHNKEVNVHPQIYVNDQLVKLEKEPKLLGVTFDTMYTFSKHAKNTVTKAKKKANMLKSLAGSTWGQEKEVLTTTFKSICRSTLEYAVPIWGPAISNTNWEALQRVQTSALRIATGCLQMAGQEHVHRETKVLPLREHATLLTKQFMATSHLPGHPGSKHLNRPPEHRKMKTSMLEHETEISNMFTSEVTTDSLKPVLRKLHTDTVTYCLNNYPPNRVLDTAPPEINAEERYLPRSVRCELSRLRSGFSRNLNDYMSRIDPSIDNSCPECEGAPHDSRHLFNCPSRPTDLEVTDLWTRPIEAANFLRLEDEREADDLLQLG